MKQRSKSHRRLSTPGTSKQHTHAMSRTPGYAASGHTMSSTSLDKDALDFDPLELLPDEAQSGEPVEVLEVRPTALEVCTSEAVINVGDGRSRRPPPPLWPSVPQEGHLGGSHLVRLLRRKVVAISLISDQRCSHARAMKTGTSVRAEFDY
eukprot:gene16658-11920_t